MMMITSNQWKKAKLGNLIFLLTLIVFISTFSETLLFPRLTTRFCYNSPEPSRVSVSGQKAIKLNHDHLN